MKKKRVYKLSTKSQSEKSEKLSSYLGKKNQEKFKNLLKLFLRTEKKAEKLKFFQKNSKCLIGLSGGQDSICLSIFLRSIQRKWGLKCEFVYCHHAMQQENFHTLMQITQYAAYTDVPCFVFVNPRISSINQNLELL